MAAAKALIPLADANAQEAEAQGALTDAVVEAFHETGLWGIWVPRSLGGGELEPVPSLEVIEHLSPVGATLSPAPASTQAPLAAAPAAPVCPGGVLPPHVPLRVRVGPRGVRPARLRAP